MKTVIEMAREAGWDDHHAEFDTRLESFAELVRADERARMAQQQFQSTAEKSELETVPANGGLLPAQQALDKMAENARELGLDYEPLAGTQVSKVWWDGEKLMAKPIPLKDFYEPAQQEPVAWRNVALRVGEDLCSVGPFGYYDMTAEQWLDWALSVVTVHAPPAQRTWVGLSDEEKRQLFDREDYQGWLDYINAIEAKLKEKNT